MNQNSPVGTLATYVTRMNRRGTIEVVTIGNRTYFKGSASGLAATYCTRYASCRAYLTKYLGTLKEVK